MRYKPERALTRDVSNLDIISIIVEMRYKPERALTRTYMCNSYYTADSHPVPVPGKKTRITNMMALLKRDLDERELW